MTHTFRMRAENGEGLELVQYEEIIFPQAPHIDPQVGAKYTEEFQFNDGDIITCTYPKSGTHWMLNMLWKLKSLDDATDRPPRDTLIEIGPPEVFANQKNPRIIGTHHKPRRLYPERFANNVRIVLFLRNPKDVVTSFFPYLKNSAAYKNKQTRPEFFQSFVEGELPRESYFTFLRDWEHVLNDISEGKSKLKVEVFYYEDFVLNPRENIARLNSFLELHRDEEYLERVLQETTMSALQKQYDRQTNMVEQTCSDDTGRSIIFRKGSVGDWKNRLTVAQSETVDALLKDTLKHGIIKFKFDM